MYWQVRCGACLRLIKRLWRCLNLGVYICEQHLHGDGNLSHNGVGRAHLPHLVAVYHNNSHLFALINTREGETGCAADDRPQLNSLFVMQTPPFWRTPIAETSLCANVHILQTTMLHAIWKEFAEKFVFLWIQLALLYFYNNFIDLKFIPCDHVFEIHSLKIAYIIYV